MPICLSVCLSACQSVCGPVCLFAVCLSVCLSNPSRDIPICMTQAAVTLCLVCICLQNLFKNFYGLLSKKRHRLNQLLHLLNSQESQGRQVKSMLWFKFTSSSNFFKLVHIFQTSLYFSNWFIFIKLVHIFQT